MPIPELAGILKPQKVHDEIRKKPQHYASESKPTASYSEIKKPSSPMEKDGPSDIIIEENVECVNVEIVAKEDRLIKVGL